MIFDTVVIVHRIEPDVEESNGILYSKAYAHTNEIEEIEIIYPKIFKFVSVDKSYMFKGCSIKYVKEESKLMLVSKQVVPIDVANCSLNIVINGRLLFNDKRDLKYILSSKIIKRFDFTLTFYGMDESYAKLHASAFTSLAVDILANIPEGSWCDFYGILHQSKKTKRFYLVVNSYHLQKKGDGELYDIKKEELNVYTRLSN